MSFVDIISTTASIVTIVTGVPTIMSAVSTKPVFIRFWQQQFKAKPALQPSPSLSTPIRKVEQAPHTANHSRQMLPPSRLEPGILYGVISGGLAALILLGGVVQYVQAGHTDSFAFDIFAYIGMGVLSILAGVLSSRASGYLQSAVIAGGILGICIFLMIFVPIILLTPPPYEGWTSGEIINLMLVCGAVGGLSFIISMLFGFLGYYLHKKMQVPAPNKNSITTIKHPSGKNAQRLQQAPHLAWQAPVQGQCQICGASNAPRAKFCNQCGTKF